MKDINPEPKIEVYKCKHILCKHYESRGKCYYKDCKFAHSREELEHNKLPCWFYNNGGCKKRDCEFLHVSPLVVGIKEEKTQPCWYHHMIGYCRFKEQCKWSHESLSEKEKNYYFSQPGDLLKGTNAGRPAQGSDLVPKALHSDIIEIKDQIDKLENSKLKPEVVQEIIKDLLKQFLVNHLKN